MRHRTCETSYLCADLVKVRIESSAVGCRDVIANLEGISTSGACLLLDDPVPLDAEVHMGCFNCPNRGTPDCQRCYLRGIVRHCRRAPGLGYEADVRFTAGSRWDRASYEPLHLTDPRTLVMHALLACSGGGEEPGGLG